MATYHQSHKLIIHIDETKSSIECRSKAIRFLTSNSVAVVESSEVFSLDSETANIPL